MSRWADAFAALSRAVDTVDTIDTTPSRQCPTSHFVNCVDCVTPLERVAEAAPEPIQASEAVQPEFHLCETSDEATPTDDLEDRAALIEYGAHVTRRWGEGYAALCSMAPPTGFSSERWRRIVDAAGSFLDRWAAEAIACGWSDLDVFGCDPARPDARFDCMGLIMLLDRCEIVGIDKDGADLVSATGIRQRFRRRTTPPGTMSLWELSGH